MQLTDQDIETIKELLRDHGSDFPNADCAAVQALGEKLGVYEPELPPTAEELKRREEFVKSPMGIAMKEMFAVWNRYMAELAIIELMDGKFWISDAENGSTLRIKLPNDYASKGIKSLD